MSEFKELIQRFEKIRAYVWDFYMVLKAETITRKKVFVPMTMNAAVLKAGFRIIRILNRTVTKNQFLSQWLQVKWQ